MKKNLNIAYLNGAEGIIRRGSASSGSSGGGSSSGEASNWRYFDMSRITSVGGRIFLTQIATLISYYDTSKNMIVFAPAGIIASKSSFNFPSDSYVAIDFNLPISYIYMDAEYQAITPQEMLNEFGIEETEITVGEITKEEFYAV